MKTTRIQLSNTEWDKICTLLIRSAQFEDYTILAKITKATGKKNSLSSKPEIKEENSSLELKWRLYLSAPQELNQSDKAALYTYTLEQEIELTQEQETELNEAYMGENYDL